MYEVELSFHTVDGIFLAAIAKTAIPARTVTATAQSKGLVKRY